MRLLLTISILIALSSVALGQDMVTGQLLDSTTNAPVQFAHVSNYRTKKMAITNVEGKFRLPVAIGDTIVFSIVGYHKMGWEVKESWLEEVVTLRILRDTTFLDEVLVYDLPPEEMFRQRMLEYQPEDTSFWYHGVEKPKPLDRSPMTETEVNSPLFAILQPADFLYEKFSKQAKEKRKYHQIVSNSRAQYVAYEKFNRDWVAEVTGLEGDVLTDFIQYCDYSLEYLEETPQYIIRENLLAKLEIFKKEPRG